LALIWAIIPLISAILFSRAEIPSLKTPEKASKVFKLFKSKSFLICFFCIFFGGASECTMSQWSSSYIEQALGIPKIWGDIFGVALFAVMLGLGRTLYTKFGKNIYKVLLLGAMGATVCYITAAISNIPLVGLFSCAITGFCTAMLWPGSLIVASNKFQTSGVAIFALMAAGGDLGGAVGPQLVGTVTDLAIKSSYFIPIANSLNLTTEQLGLKIGLVSATIFPLIATILFAVTYKNYNNCKK
ncbi:MAG: MFS transporter, partial [Oscillospiraceae bacterium]